jgi:hypothetical protein
VVKEVGSGTISFKRESLCNVPLQIGVPERRLNGLNCPVRL